MTDYGFEIKTNIAGAHDGPADEVRYGDIHIDVETDVAVIDIYLPKSSYSDIAKVNLNAIKRIVPTGRK